MNIKMDGVSHLLKSGPSAQVIRDVSHTQVLANFQAVLIQNLTETPGKEKCDWSCEVSDSIAVLSGREVFDRLTYLTIAVTIPETIPKTVLTIHRRKSANGIVSCRCLPVSPMSRD